ncbi:methylaspartate mutase sigma subunit [Nocardia tenerifensis]|uniref:Methylaspartate mutase sigma subunit n=1 Tax=Nocardia tenerifensis TaxID=228006 RepID=A0A318KAU6_9NOCA|nr:hypothetical protein [Nocardia tenerifensis]PXX71468.1 methylaspartate mutase sigma subunit [Nocardia tenerifensis]
MERAENNCAEPTLGRATVVISGTVSDAHTWNLVYLQLLIEELGLHAVNLGPCVPVDVLARECRELAPALVVIGSINGHGHQDGLRLIEHLRADPLLAELPIVIGGKLGIADDGVERRALALTAAGFDAVFEDAASGVAEFRDFVQAVTHPAAEGLELWT